jgi:hypothetical protein
MLSNANFIKKAEEITTVINNRDIPIEELIFFYDVDNKDESEDIIKQQIERRFYAS